jgi:hypothetical protein
MHSKTPSAFKKNIKTEMAHGKPQKQAVAIAYSEKAHAEHKKHLAMGGECEGPSCYGCSDKNCYAKGGKVDDGDMFEPRETLPASHPEKHHKGVHETVRFGDKGVSTAGADLRNAHDTKEDHMRVLEELRGMKKPNLYAEGGNVNSSGNSGHSRQNEKGIHSSWAGGISKAGAHARSSQLSGADEQKERRKGFSKEEHHRVLGEMRSMPKPNLYAEGGEVHEDAEQDQEMMDEEIKNMMGDELMAAIDAKDRKGIMEAIEAIVLSCKGRD